MYSVLSDVRLDVEEDDEDCVPHDFVERECRRK